MGTAYIQELRFNKYCERLQRNVSPIFDEEFKLWIANKGYTVDNSLFEIKMNPPQNFAQYRQTEMDQARVGTFTQVAELPYMSKRFALKRYLGLTEEEMSDNAQQWAEENAVKQKQPTKSAELRQGGVTQSGITSDLDQFEEPIATDTGDAGAGGTPTTGGNK